MLPGGGKSWRFKYTFGGKERRIVFWPYPDITLKRAREMRDDAKRLLREGSDPGLESKRARHTRKVGHENTFEFFARNWHEQQKDAWKEVHANDVITSMERDLFPAIGAFPVNEIDEGLLFSALRGGGEARRDRDGPSPPAACGEGLPVRRIPTPP